MRRRLLITALVGGLLLSGCGTQKASVTSLDLSPAAAVKSAAAATKAAHSARVTACVTMSLGTKKVAFSLTGPMSLDGQQADVTGTVPGASIGATSDIGIHEILDHHTVYLRYEASGAPSGWFRMDAGSAAAKRAAGLAGGPGVDQQLTALEKLAHVAKVGSETVDGVDTVHYSGTLDARALSSMVASLGKGAASVGPVPMDLWIDDRGRVVQLTEALTLARGAQTTTATVSATFSDWGIPVRVTAPGGAKDVSTLSGG
jgi:hypothetical protein